MVEEVIYDDTIGAIVLYGKDVGGALIPVQVDDNGRLVVNNG